ncbi:hypothetical protein B4168_0485 [Anoxybacillus flavithermus]|nr:hypothetical protein B4168_0485 [Anoxybacillus flavithermus]OAO87139.1 hypothetical protein GT23_1482 [Parageobacillus thermoglucosidasius]
MNKHRKLSIDVMIGFPFFFIVSVMTGKWQSFFGVCFHVLWVG